MATRLEMLLYHGLDETGSIEVSAVSSSGPWTKLTLTSTKRIGEALGEWQDLANAALPALGWNFIVDWPGDDYLITIYTTGGTGWVRFPPCLAMLLGYSATIIDTGGAGGDQPALGLLGSTRRDSDAYVAAGVTFPFEVEEAELNEYRAARASVHHYGRAAEVVVDLFVPAALWAVVRASPMLSGHAAFYLEADNPTPFDEDNLDGALTLYPLAPLAMRQDAPGAPMWIRLRCTMDDPA